MRDTTPWPEEQRLAMWPHRSLVGETFRTMYRIRECIRYEDQEGFRKEIKALRERLAELEVSVLQSR